MDMLRCDICGGSLMMQAGGKTAVCDSCGMQYSVERVREKVQEIRGAVRVEGAVQARQTGTDDDVAQWRMLVRKYYDAGDFQAANQIVKKILEAIPTDAEANQMYDELQVLKYMEIKNGILVKYTGLAETLTIPGCVKEIGAGAFEYNRTLESVCIPESVVTIGSNAFYGSDLQSLHIPESVIGIGGQAFDSCRRLKSVTIPERLIREEIFGHTFDNGDCYLEGCPWYAEYRHAMEERKQVEWRKKDGRCQYCGFKFSSGLFGPIKCKNCGRPKDY